MLWHCNKLESQLSYSDTGTQYCHDCLALSNAIGRYTMLDLSYWEPSHLLWILLCTSKLLKYMLFIPLTATFVSCFLILVCLKLVPDEGIWIPLHNQILYFGLDSSSWVWHVLNICWYVINELHVIFGINNTEDCWWKSTLAYTNEGNNNSNIRTSIQFKMTER
jgi:hypothetical protein